MSKAAKANTKHKHDAALAAEQRVNELAEDLGICRAVLVDVLHSTRARLPLDLRSRIMRVLDARR